MPQFCEWESAMSSPADCGGAFCNGGNGRDGEGRVAAMPDPSAGIEWDPSRFSGRAPLFPLPNAVLFPHALLPLHIFEPRYRQMTADALAGEQLIAMAILDGSVVEGAGGLPKIASTVGLGQVVAHQLLDDGRYYLALRGVARARLRREIPSPLPYRLGELELLPETGLPDPARQAEQVRQLLARVLELLPAVREHPFWQAATSDLIPLGVVCDLVASALPLSTGVAQRLLAESHVQRRHEALLTILEQLPHVVPLNKSVRVPRGETFPPRFSQN